MKVSTRVEYGLVALTDIVIHGENGQSVSAPDIAQRQNISHKYLEHILLLLRQAGFIKAQKGIRGGYTLACSPDKISMSDVLNALDMSILEGMETDGEDGLRSVVNENFWDKINDNLRSYTEELKLSDFAERCRSSTEDNWDMYMI